MKLSFETEEKPIGLLIAVVRQRLKRRLLHALDGHRVTPAQMGLLLQLYDRDGLTPSEIAQRTLMDQPMITRVLHRLERAGLVSRSRDPGDGRRVRIWATPRARALGPPLMRIAAKMDRQMMGAVSRAEERKLRRMLYRIIQNLEEGP
jgi:DNA-binding MarR family transcriptional regulator